MELSEYLSQPEKTQTELARQLDVSQGLIHQWITKKTKITPTRAIEIERATGGVVTKRTLCPDFPWDEAAA